MPDFINSWWEALNFEMQIFYGIAAVLLVALMLYFMRAFLRCRSKGNIGNAIGQVGTVHLTIPPVQRPGGEVETMIQGKLVTTEALQKGSQPLQPGTKVKIVARIGSSTLMVEPLD